MSHVDPIKGRIYRQRYEANNRQRIRDRERNRYNTPEGRAKATAAQVRYRQRNRAIVSARSRAAYEANPYRLRIIAEKLERGWCSNESCPVGLAVSVDNLACFDFDHRDPATKTEAIGKYSAWMRLGMAALEAEMAACDLLCAWCHRVRTTQEGHWGNRQRQALGFIRQGEQLSLFDETAA